MEDSKYREAKTICALRFDGYKYAEMEKLAELSRRAETEFPFESDNDNFAAFFALQRYLYKGSGERLPLDHPLHQLFDRMFRQLAPLDIPLEFAHPEYVRKWQNYKTLLSDS
jgi:hypothetical protein